MAKQRQRGVALLIAIMTVALLTIVTIQFTHTTQVDYRRTAHWSQARQAQLLAESGLAMAAEVLARAPLLHAAQFQRRKLADGLNELWAQRCEEPGPEVCPNNLSRSCTVDMFEDTLLAVQIDDETGLYNLNRMVTAGASERQRLGRLLAAAGLGPQLLESISSWTQRSSRGLTFTHSAHSSYPKRGEVRFPGRGGPLTSFRELALLPGVGVKELVALRRLTTALPADAVRVNINTAPLAVLRALDAELDDEVLLAKLHRARCARPLENIEDLRKAIGLDGPASFDGLITFRSEYFRVRATAAVGDVFQSVEALLHRPYPSDFASSNRTEWDIGIIYHLVRRGPNIPDIDTSAVTSLADIGRTIRSGGGLL